MCVIAVCFKDCPRPTHRALLAMAKANHDGFGFVSESDYFKTLDFNEFYERFKRIPKNENVIIHFRWATHGSVKIENCHPFQDGRTFFAHNGVLRIPSKNDMTDSEICFRRDIMPYIKIYGIEPLTELINDCRESSRFAIMHEGKIHLYGDYQTFNGVLYSNLRWTAYYDMPVRKKGCLGKYIRQAV